jgi:membrane-associated phospholipid phosphatase
MWSFYACCVIAMVFAPAKYVRLRRVFLLSMLFALPWYALYPLAPPRFMVEEGFIDTLAKFGPNYFSESGLVSANRFAAMPSMHIGWSTIGAIMVGVSLPKWRIGWILGITHVILMCLTVMITGNHWWLDIVGGWLIVLAAFAVARRLPAEIRWPWATRRPADEPLTGT